MSSSGSSPDTVGSLLASIANSLNDSLRMLMFADKRQWGPDEFEQIRALEDALDDAKRDFQELGPLVNGQFYYENDRRTESLEELRVLKTKFDFHAQNFKDWLRTGGPINPIWARETGELKRELHRAQCRAARRIFQSEKEDSVRCLGAFEVYRQQRILEAQRQEQQQQQQRYEQNREELPRWEVQDTQQELREQQRKQDKSPEQIQYSQRPDAIERRLSLEELVPACNAVGRFERFGDRDIAFSCDFCDGFIVWEDVQNMPPSRTPLSPGITDQPNWQATTKSISTGEDKTVVFAPLAIANHLGPQTGDWKARIWCPFCDEYTYYQQGDDELDQVKYAQDEQGFPDLKAFQEHLEWYHTSVQVPAIAPSTGKCVVM